MNKFINALNLEFLDQHVLDMISKYIGVDQRYCVVLETYDEFDRIGHYDYIREQYSNIQTNSPNFSKNNTFYQIALDT